MALFLITSLSCVKASPRKEKPLEDDSGISQFTAEKDNEQVFRDFLDRILQEAEIPQDLSLKIRETAEGGPSLIMDILTCLAGDPYLHLLVDKTHALPPGYAPGDLVQLTGTAGGGSYEISRHGLMLRSAAAEALEEMAAAAKADGVTLTVGSSYRSYDYQVEVYTRNVEESGQENADRESARPGFSQHQTGLVVDFAPIDNAFAGTPPGKWVLENAGRFGWSVSFPDGYENITGYRWESWHYRYVGKDLAAFIDTYFASVQQYALRFLRQWELAEQ
ncbi:MAG: M15 family metallopeptidase [Treponema sp.]|nr:M15 family metallopeptidase [Treponema sp.]